MGEVQEIVSKCPYHGLLRWLQIQTFYNELSEATQLSIDAATVGSLIGKIEEVAFDVFEEMAANNYPSLVERLGGRRHKVFMRLIPFCL